MTAFISALGQACNPDRLVPRLRVRQRLTLLVITPLLTFLVCVGVIAPRAIESGRQVERLMRQANAIVAETRLVHELAVREDAARNYLSTSDASYLGPYRDAKPAAVRYGEQILSLVQTEPAEQPLARRLVSVAARLLSDSETTVARARSGALSPAARRAAIVRRPRTIDALVASAARLREAQVGRLEAYGADFRAILQGSLVIFAAFFVVAIAVTMALVLVVSRSFVRRVETLTEKSRRFSRGVEIGGRLDGADEIAELDRVFHAMVDEVRAREMDFSYYAVLAESVRDMIIFVDPSSRRILRANRACCESLGYRSDELTTLTLDALRPSRRSGFEQLREGTRQGEILYETTCIRKDGTSFPIEVSAHTARVNGANVAVMVARDITERQSSRRQLAEALDGALSASKAKSEFLSTMSHEIRTPMNVVLGITEALEETRLDEEQREHVGLMREAGNNLMSVINDILDFSKIEAGKLELSSRKVSCAQLVENVRALFASEADRKTLELAARADPRIAPAVEADGGRLNQILTNLVGNALKFTDAGMIVIAATLIREVEGVQTIEFSVEDTGTGIPAELRGRLFEPFTQADGSRTRRQTGTGLGLSICKRLVDLMQGEIGVTSILHRGSRFWFTVPLRRIDPESQALPADERVATLVRSTALPQDGGLTRVLLVEDHWMNRRVAVGQLTKLGLSVAIAENGYAGAARGAAEPFDLIFMDCQMPGLDGLSATRSIRSAERGTGRHVPIVAMTANVFEEERNRCFAAGMDDFVAKPVTIEALRRVLARWLPASREPVAS